jgi:protein-tyrosine-phosphatase
MAEPLRVLFVCTANICRSPVMEVLARDLAGDPEQSGVEFTSAGTHARDGHPFNPDMTPTLPATLDPDAAGAFRSRHLSTAILDEADLVLTAESVHRQHILDDRPQLHRKVFTLGQFEAIVAEQPGLSGRELVAAAGQRRTPSAPEHDVADPYRRGKAAAQQATGTITAMLSVIVPRLTGRAPSEETR